MKNDVLKKGGGKTETLSDHPIAKVTGQVVLCDVKTEKVSVHVVAEFDGAKLTISGQDCGTYPEEFWGDDDYEYWYYFDEQNTSRLLQKICEHTSNPLIALKDNFNGLDGCQKLREYCDSLGIEYHFDSWI